MLRKRILTAATAIAIAAGTAVVATAPADAVTGSNVAIFVENGNTLRVVDLAPTNAPTLNMYFDSYTSIALESTAPLHIGAGCVAKPERRGKAFASCSLQTIQKTRFDLGGGNDTLSVVTAVPVEIHGGPGIDTITLNAPVPTGNQIFGEGERDIIKTLYAATIDGGGGNDDITGSNDPDDITGGSGSDTIRGWKGNDTIRVKDGEFDDVNCNDKKQDRISADSIDLVKNCEIPIP
jgi:Ca2+-binding RTX toxin-like protein